MPDRFTAWGLPAVALSAMLSEAVRFPEAEGVKVTVIVQEPPLAATELGERGHVVVSPKSPALVPVTEMLAIVKLMLPVSVRVMVCDGLDVPMGSLPKVRLAAERLTMEAVPVPVRVTGWGLPDALSAILIDAVRLLMAVGVNVTLIVQLLLAANELPHVLADTAKSVALVPVTEMPVMVKLALPVLVRVVVRAVLVIPWV